MERMMVNYGGDYTAYAEENENGVLSLSCHNGEMPAHQYTEFDTQAALEAAMEEIAPLSEWREVEGETGCED